MEKFRILKVISNRVGRPKDETYFIIEMQNRRGKWRAVVDSSSDVTFAPQFPSVQSAVKYIYDVILAKPETEITICDYE